MRPLATEFLTPFEAALIRADAAAMVADPQIHTAVTYRSFSGSVFSPSTGITTDSYTEYDVFANRSVITAKEVAISNGRYEVSISAGLYQMGDVKYTFDRASLPITPADEDTIVEGTATYKVIDWNTDPLNVLWNIVARRIE